VKLGEEIKLSFFICGTSIATHFGPLHAGKARDQRRGAGHHLGGQTVSGIVQVPLYLGAQTAQVLSNDVGWGKPPSSPPERSCLHSSAETNGSSFVRSQRMPMLDLLVK
jgi:hypothetical protein